MSQDRDLVEEERQAARLAASADDRTRPSNTGRGMDPGTKKLAIVAGGLGGLLVLMVGGWSLLGHRPAGVPILSPPPGPVRIKPLDPGGMQLMGTQVAQTNNAGPESLAPGPEQAAPQALQAEVDKARQADRPALAPVPKASAPAPAATAPAATSAGAGPVASAVAPTPATPAATPSAMPVAAPTATVTAPAPASEPEPPVRATTAPVVEDAAPPPAATGHHAVQLAALDSSAAAHTEWTRLTHRAPALFAGRTPAVAATTRDGKQFFRLRTGGFGSVAEATAFCARVRAAGIACTLADF